MSKKENKIDIVEGLVNKKTGKKTEKVKFVLEMFHAVIFFIKPCTCRQSLLEAVGLCVENASVDQLSFAINKIFLTGFDEKVLHGIMSIISERLVLPIIKYQDSEATNLTNRACCREVKIPNQYGGVIFWCLLMYRIDS